ncbi:Protein of unknown function [Propionibacterium freudenreichii]|nr:Protein of unknown function [Propionibacterium freudenreichii]
MWKIISGNTNSGTIDGANNTEAIGTPVARDFLVPQN